MGLSVCPVFKETFFDPKISFIYTKKIFFCGGIILLYDTSFCSSRRVDHKNIEHFGCLLNYKPASPVTYFLKFKIHSKQNGGFQIYKIVSGAYFESILVPFIDKQYDKMLHFPKVNYSDYKTLLVSENKSN